jgi:hypothetical protein
MSVDWGEAADTPTSPRPINQETEQQLGAIRHDDRRPR